MEVSAIVKFYAVRYKRGKTEIPQRWRKEVMDYLAWEKEQEDK